MKKRRREGEKRKEKQEWNEAGSKGKALSRRTNHRPEEPTNESRASARKEASGPKKSGSAARGNITVRVRDAKTCENGWPMARAEGSNTDRNKPVIYIPYGAISLGFSSGNEADGAAPSVTHRQSLLSSATHWYWLRCPPVCRERYIYLCR